MYLRYLSSSYSLTSCSSLDTRYYFTVRATVLSHLYFFHTLVQTIKALYLGIYHDKLSEKNCTMASFPILYQASRLLIKHIVRLVLLL